LVVDRRINGEEFRLRRKLLDETMIIELGTQAMKTATLVAGPMLAAALIIGLGVSVMQAVTQINEATLTFIPKILVVALVLILMGPWMLDVLKSFTQDLFLGMVDLVRQ